MNVIAFAASTSKTSINKKLATYFVGLLNASQSKILDLNDFELPLFSVDKEEEIGQPAAAKDFLGEIEAADVVVVSFAEHNGSYTAAYKNLFDWVSRIKKKVYEGKKVVLLSTSPGPGGAKNVLAAAESSFPHFGAEIIGSLSVPKFNENFDKEKCELVDQSLLVKMRELVSKVETI